MIRLLTFLLVLRTLAASAQTDNVGAGRAIRFDAVDDRIDIQSNYSNLNLPFTISAWINVPSSNNAAALAIFSSNDNDPLYHGFWFIVAKGAIWCEYGDNQGGANPSFRQGKRASVVDFYGRWTHVAAVMVSLGQFILYVDGVNVGGALSGSSGFPMQSPHPTDVAKAGYFLSNNVPYRFECDMDELTLWGRALSQDEIRANMCRKLTGNEPGLISYWPFDETSGNTTYDKAKKASNAVLVGNPTRVYSGAPVGDISINHYQSSLYGQTFKIEDGSKAFEVSELHVNIIGIHLYEVKSPPSRTMGLSIPNEQPYFGVFLVATTPFAAAKARYLENGNSTCGILIRIDNSSASWSGGSNSPPIIERQLEIIRGVNSSQLPTADLGVDRSVCNGSLLSTNSPTATGFLWNTGATSPTINVNGAGAYWVTVTNQCGSDRDTVNLQIIEPPKVDLGPDRTICDRSSYFIDSGVSGPGITYKWSNNATSSGINVLASGTYTVEVTGQCGTSTDGLVLKLMATPPAFSLGVDEEHCLMPRRQLVPFSNTLGVQFDWQDGSHGPSFEANDFGTFWVIAKNDCGTARDSITFRKTPNIDLPQIPNVITPNGDQYNQTLIVSPKAGFDVSLLVLNRWGQRVFESYNYRSNWDGGDLPTGTYFYVVEGACVNRVKGSISIIR